MNFRKARVAISLGIAAVICIAWGAVYGLGDSERGPLPGDVVIYSVLANAQGGTSDEEIPSECITLRNASNRTIDLRGIIIADEQGSWRIPEDQEDAQAVPPGGLWRVCGLVYNPTRCTRTCIALNNSTGETLTLSYKQIVIDKITYPGGSSEGTTIYRSQFSVHRSEIGATYGVASAPAACVTVSAVDQEGEWGIAFLGAAGEVPGSSYLVRLGEESILVDCGSFMNAEGLPAEDSEHSDDEFFFDPTELSAVLITHAHADHIGRLHKLFEAGYHGPVYMTAVTRAIYYVTLGDTIHYSCVNPVVESELRDPNIVLAVPYGEPTVVTDSCTATFINAGHIPGSASIVLEILTPTGDLTLVFSGDIGPGDHPFLADPDLASYSSVDADLLVLESTYGDTQRGEPTEELVAFLDAVKAKTREGDLVVVPTFALDRTQRILHTLAVAGRNDPAIGGLRVGVGGKSSCNLTDMYLTFQSNPEVWADFFRSEFFADDTLFPVQMQFIRGPGCSCSECEREVNYAALKEDYDVIVTPSGFGTSSLSKKLIEEFQRDPEVSFIKVGWAPDDSPIVGLGKFRAGVPALANDFWDVSSFFSGHTDQDGLVSFVRAFAAVHSVVITHGDPGASSALEAALVKSIGTLTLDGITIPVFRDFIPFDGR
ncbi:MAG: MBL fold metallo-hydrolase [Candidatus Thorarchaeota archaeon]